MSEISRIHFITQDAVPGFSHAELAEQACIGGADWVQLRVKEQPEEVVEAIAFEVEAVCRNYGAKLIINDFPQVAKRVKANGVHLGKTDLNPVEARKLLGDSFIIGGTANSIEDIKLLHEAKVDYIGLGPFRFTSTKKNLSPILGHEGYHAILSECKTLGLKIPVIAIGGILPVDISDILAAGFHGIAISSAVNTAKDKSAAMKHFIEVMSELTSVK
jgi:thiamine-phosphate pyrophosphorylase